MKFKYILIFCFLCAWLGLSPFAFAGGNDKKYVDCWGAREVNGVVVSPKSIDDVIKNIQVYLNSGMFFDDVYFNGECLVGYFGGKSASMISSVNHGRDVIFEVTGFEGILPNYVARNGESVDGASLRIVRSVENGSMNIKVSLNVIDSREELSFEKVVGFFGAAWEVDMSEIIIRHGAIQNENPSKYNGPRKILYKNIWKSGAGSLSLLFHLDGKLQSAIFRDQKVD